MCAVVQIEPCIHNVSEQVFQIQMNDELVLMKSRHEKLTGNYGFLCKNCGNIEKRFIDINITVTHQVIDTDEDASSWVNYFLGDAGCKKCGSQDEMEIIDPNMIEPIRLLNECGLKTSFSCEGHEDSLPYIAFDRSVTVEEFLKLPKLPKMWYVDLPPATIIDENKNFSSIAIRCNPAGYNLDINKLEDRAFYLTPFITWCRNVNNLRHRIERGMTHDGHNINSRDSM